MSFTVHLGNLPAWVTADDIKSWLVAEDLAADSVKVIRDRDTQESRGFAFVEAPSPLLSHSFGCGLRETGIFCVALGPSPRSVSGPAGSDRRAP
jgi:hypothetical protein